MSLLLIQNFRIKQFNLFDKGRPNTPRTDPFQARVLSRRFLFSLTLCSFIAVYQMSSCSQIVFVPNELFADLNAGGGVRIPVCPAALNKKTA